MAAMGDTEIDRPPTVQNGTIRHNTCLIVRYCVKLCRIVSDYVGTQNKVWK